MADTSASLLGRLRDRSDVGAWNRFIHIYTPLVQGWLCRLAAPPSEIDDLVQEVMTVVVRELPDFRYDPARGSFRGWLRTITANRLREVWRARRSRPTASGDGEFLNMVEQLEDPASSLSQLWDHEHDRHVAHQLLATIEPDFEPKTYQAFQRVVMGGEKAAAVAAKLGLSVNAVLIAKSRVLARLRQEVQGLTD